MTATDLRESVLGGSVSLVAARLGGLAFGLVSAMLVSRHLGVSDYGRMSSVLAFWTIFTLTSEMGVSSVVAAEMGRRGADVPSLWLAGVAVQTGFSVLAALAGLGVGLWVFRGQPDMTAGITAGTLIVFSSMPAVNSIHQVRFRMRVPAAIGLLQSALTLALSAAGVMAHLPWRYFITASAVCGIAAVALNFAVAWREARGRRTAVLASSRVLARAAAVVGLAGIFATLYFKLDTVLVYRIAGARQAGLYGAAYRLFELILIVPNAVLVSATPVAAGLLHRDVPRYRRVSGTVAGVLLWLGIADSLVATALGRLGLSTVFGPAFTDATPLLLLLIGGAMARHLSIWVGTLLIATGRRTRFLCIAAVSACVAITADLLLIPVLAARGAAMVTGGIETLVLVADWVALDRCHRPEIPARALIPLAAALPLWLVAAAVCTRGAATLPWMGAGALPIAAAAVLAWLALRRLGSLPRGAQ